MRPRRLRFYLLDLILFVLLIGCGVTLHRRWPAWSPAYSLEGVNAQIDFEIAIPDEKSERTVIKPVGTENLVLVWDNKTGTHRTLEFKIPVSAVALSPDQRLLAVAMVQRVELCDPLSGQPVFELPCAGTVSEVAFGKDSERIAVVLSSPVRVSVWRRNHSETPWGWLWLPEVWFGALIVAVMLYRALAALRRPRATG